MSRIRYEIVDRVATVTIDRPDKRNAMTFADLADFESAVVRAGEDDGVAAVVITGAGGAFCAGTDLTDLAATPEGERSGGGHARQGEGAGKAPWSIVGCPKPVIAAVDGPAVGLGVELATQCDVRIATTRARFGWVFVRRGLVPDTGAGTLLLPRLIGPSAPDGDVAAGVLPLGRPPRRRRRLPRAAARPLHRALSRSTRRWRPGGGAAGRPAAATWPAPAGPCSTG